jgi:predicted dehydrogenase
MERNVPPGYNIEDASVVNLKFARGAVGTIWASTSANGGTIEATLSVYASQTTAHFTTFDVSLSLLRKDTQPEVIPGEPSAHRKYIEDSAFLEAILAGDSSRILSPYSDGLKTLEVTLAANESMDKGSPIKVNSLD